MIHALFAIVLAGASTTGLPHPADPGSAVRPDVVQSEPFGEAVNRMLTALREERAEDALAIAKSLTTRSDFDSQNLVVRRGVWHLIGSLNAELGRHEAAIEPLRTASRMPGAEADIWFALITAEARAGRRDDAARTVIALTRALPSAIESASDAFIYQLARSPDVSVETRFDLRDALWEAGWNPKSSSGFWLAYIDGLLERGRMDRALEALPRVTSPSALTQLHASHRYDDLRARAATPALDIDAAYARALEDDRAAAEAADATIDDRQGFASSLLMAGRFEEALTVADAALALPRPAKDDEDWNAVTWAMDTRSRVLMALGRPDEAVAQMREATLRVEVEDGNTSQTINLGWMYLRTGRNAEALAAVADIDEGDASPYGLMQAAQVTACAAQALGDTLVANKAQAYLAEHWRDAPTAAYEALACKGDADAMAALLIRRLEDPELAETTLGDLHIFLPAPNPTAFDARIIAITTEVQARPDVIAARDRVGRVLTLPVLGGQF